MIKPESRLSETIFLNFFSPILKYADASSIVKQNLSLSSTGLAPLRRSAEALPVACDALNARTTAVKEYHCTNIWIMAAELLSLLWNADIFRSVCPSFRRRVSAQRLPIYRMYPVCPILRRRYLAPLSLSKCFISRAKWKRENTLQMRFSLGKS